MERAVVIQTDNKRVKLPKDSELPVTLEGARVGFLKDFEMRKDDNGLYYLAGTYVTEVPTDGYLKAKHDGKKLDSLIVQPKS